MYSYSTDIFRTHQWLWVYGHFKLYSVRGPFLDIKSWRTKESPRAESFKAPDGSEICLISLDGALLVLLPESLSPRLFYISLQINRQKTRDAEHLMV